MAPATPPRLCPACGGVNAPDAVFCADPRCHKALGEFRFVREEMHQSARWHETLADRVVGFIGKPHFLGVHAFWFALWVLLNTGMLALVHRFDGFPFALLGILLAMETIFITGFVLISQNRQTTHADTRAELDYEVNVRTYRKIVELEALVRTLSDRVDALAGQVGHSHGGGGAGAS